MPMTQPGLEIRVVGTNTETALARFFSELRAAGVDNFFHPHPFTAEAARERATYAGRDLYYILAEGNQILGYGMLRGWDEGFDVPSLGIVIHPQAQRLGFGRLLMDFLRAAALRRGAPRMRLRVHPDNAGALDLYRSLGYAFAAEKEGAYLVGILELGAHRASPP